MSYSPRPEDLDEPAMSPEIAAIADGVLPFNRERMAENIADFNRAMASISAVFTVRAQPAVDAFRRFAQQVGARAAWAEYQRYGRTRPDGRPRRTGHRHRGMPAWNRRHG